MRTCYAINTNNVSPKMNVKSSYVINGWKASSVMPKINKSKEISEEITKQKSEYIHMPMPDELKRRPIVGGTRSVTKGLTN